MSGFSWFVIERTAPSATWSVSSETVAPSDVRIRTECSPFATVGSSRTAAHEADEEPRDRHVARHRVLDRRRLAPAVGGEQHVGGQHAQDAVDVAVAQRLEELAREARRIRVVDVEADPATCHPRSRAVHDLPARGGIPLDHLRDLRVAESERLVQDEHRPLDRPEPLEHHEHRDGDRLVVLDAVCRIVVVDEQGLGQPRTHVDLAGPPGGAQHVDGEPRGHGRRERVGALDGLPGAGSLVHPQESRLHHVLGLRHAAEHAVGDGEHQGAERRSFDGEIHPPSLSHDGEVIRRRG